MFVRFRDWNHALLREVYHRSRNEKRAAHGKICAVLTVRPALYAYMTEADNGSTDKKRQSRICLTAGRCAPVFADGAIMQEKGGIST